MSNQLISFLKYLFLLLMVVLNVTTCFSQSNTKNEHTIEGKLQIDSIWAPVVYLSHIPTFNDMNTMSNEMIIAEAQLDSLGTFKFSTKSLPKQDNLFRLHISKKEAPAASLIIGGKEENHLFFIANSNSSIYISNIDSPVLFKAYHIEGYYPNKSFQSINMIIRSNEYSDSNLSSVKREFATKTTQERTQANCRY